MFETRSEAWERVGLSIETSKRAVRRARGEVALALPALVAVLIVYSNRQSIFGHPDKATNDAITWVTVAILLLLGWTLARAIGRAAGPTFFRRMDPATAGTVSFIIRLLTMGITLLVALGVAGVSAPSLIAGGAFTAIILGLAAQQTLGNLFAGLVLITARPFRVGERVRLQAGAIGGIHEGVVSSLGLMYTTLARGADRIMIPNMQVISAVVMPIIEPSPVDVRVRLGVDIRPSQVQAIMDDQIRTPTRSRATVLLEEIDPNELVVRVQATPERAEDGAQLADEIIATLASITGQHEVIRQGGDGSAPDGDGTGAADQPAPGLRSAGSGAGRSSVRTTSSGR